MRLLFCLKRKKVYYPKKVPGLVIYGYSPIENKKMYDKPTEKDFNKVSSKKK